MKRKPMHALAIVSLLSLFVIGCDRPSKDKPSDRAEDVVEQFCLSYFTLHYADAATYCTEDSKRWLSFAASNIHEEDLSVLHSSSEGVSVRVMEMDVPSHDSIGSALVRVRNYLSADRIDAPARLTDEGLFRIGLVKRGSRWWVRMEGLPQSETRSRD